MTQVPDSAWSKGNFNTWGLLVVPRAYNGGTGLARMYVNRVPGPIGDITWTGADTYGIEASNFTTFMTVNDLITPYRSENIVCFKAP